MRTLQLLADVNAGLIPKLRRRKCPFEPFEVVWIRHVVTEAGVSMPR